MVRRWGKWIGWGTWALAGCGAAASPSTAAAPRTPTAPGAWDAELSQVLKTSSRGASVRPARSLVVPEWTRRVDQLWWRVDGQCLPMTWRPDTLQGWSVPLCSHDDDGRRTSCEQTGISLGSELTTDGVIACTRTDEDGQEMKSGRFSVADGSSWMLVEAAPDRLAYAPRWTVEVEPLQGVVWLRTGVEVERIGRFEAVAPEPAPDGSSFEALRAWGRTWGARTFVSDDEPRVRVFRDRQGCEAHQGPVATALPFDVCR